MPRLSIDESILAHACNYPPDLPDPDICISLSLPQFERATKLELFSVLLLMVITLSIYTFYASLHSYLRSVLLMLRLEGPPLVPILGNCHMITDKGGKIVLYIL